jgi:hypothetical protein
VQSTQVSVVNGGSRGPGRPVGARNKRTDEAARFYMSRFGDPLARGVEIAAIPILAQDGRVLRELAGVLGMTRSDAAKWWASIYAATLPAMFHSLSYLCYKNLIRGCLRAGGFSRRLGGILRIPGWSSTRSARAA